MNFKFANLQLVQDFPHLFVIVAPTALDGAWW